jgi:hypothetical protein
VRRFLRWLVGVPDVIDWEEVRLITNRIVELNDKCLSLDRRFTRLQGEVSRSWRDRYEDTDDESDDDVDDEVNELIRRRLRG